MVCASKDLEGPAHFLLDNEMTQRQADYCTFRDINILVCSWNLDSAKPSDLVGTEANVLLLEELLGSVESPDIVVFGFQEVIPLTDKKLTASACCSSASWSC